MYSEAPNAEGLIVTSTLRRVKLSRLTLGLSKAPRPHFDLRADIDEKEVAPGRLSVKYSISVETFPLVQRAEIEGSSSIFSDSQPSTKDTGGLGEAQLMKVALEIYRQNFESLYLLFSSMGLEAPSPWLIRDVRLEKP